ncbi:MAG: hypothetical protein NZ893_02385 [Candidatus Aenigmarchaeota archaeon]|nr:hypothetical protein [Candidatus Aenigmarchaeota archaeon]
MYGIERILQSDVLFVYVLSFIVLFTLIYDILRRLNLFNNKNVDMVVTLIICFYVFLTNGYRIINFILSLSTVGMVILFGILLIVIIFLNFYRKARYEAVGY